MGTIETMSKWPIKKMSDLWWIFEMRWSGRKNVERNSNFIRKKHAYHVWTEKWGSFELKRKKGQKGERANFVNLETKRRKGKSEWVIKRKERKGERDKTRERESEKRKKEKKNTNNRKMWKKVENGEKKRCNETLDKSKLHCSYLLFCQWFFDEL